MDFNPIEEELKMALIEYGRTHVHTENSVEDALPAVEAVAEKMSEMGAKACAITMYTARKEGCILSCLQRTISVLSRSVCLSQSQTAMS